MPDTNHNTGLGGVRLKAFNSARALNSSGTLDATLDRRRRVQIAEGLVELGDRRTVGKVGVLDVTLFDVANGRFIVFSKGVKQGGRTALGETGNEEIELVVLLDALLGGLSRFGPAEAILGKLSMRRTNVIFFLLG